MGRSYAAPACVIRLIIAAVAVLLTCCIPPCAWDAFSIARLMACAMACVATATASAGASATSLTFVCVTASVICELTLLLMIVRLQLAGSGHDRRRTQRGNVFHFLGLVHQVALR